ncbi:MAG: hypothetical protein AB7S77_13480 [Desulfatirhabdiaceae bacterium]
MPIKWVVDISGWIGAVSLLMAYALVSMRRLDGKSITYQIMNLLGGLFLLVNSFYYGAYPSVGLNGIWIAIGIFTLIQNRKRGKRPGKKKDKGGRLKTEG